MHAYKHARREIVYLRECAQTAAHLHAFTCMHRRRPISAHVACAHALPCETAAKRAFSTSYSECDMQRPVSYTHLTLPTILLV
eukprot:6209195-Pleurochrysis_carterae.AAC.1